MNRSTRGRAVVARARRPLSWAALAALWTLQASGFLSTTSMSDRGSLGASGTTIRADLIDDIIHSIFGGSEDPPPPAPDPDPVDPDGGW